MGVASEWPRRVGEMMIGMPFDVIAIVSALVSCAVAFVAVAYSRMAIIEAQRAIRAADAVVKNAKRQDN